MSIVIDIETASHPLADQFVEPPDLENITAAKNLKNPDLIAADIAKRRADAQAEHAAKVGKCALDFNLSRIVAIGWKRDDEPTGVLTAGSEREEAGVLESFWQLAGREELVGFRIRTFDAPTLMARSRYLGVRYPALDLGRYNRGGRIIDLWDVLSFGLSDYDTTVVMSRKLTTYAKRYGIPVSDDIKGSDIAALVTAGDWDAIVSHVRSDVELTAALARRLGVLPQGSVTTAEPIGAF